ncbi:MAG: cobalt-precorrin-5B (C(1))-methyltransferase, partial [Oscillospiraceae bacterium]
MDVFIMDTFAAAAAKAATLFILTGVTPGKVRIVTTKKETVTVAIVEAKAGIFDAFCSVLSFCSKDETPLKVTALARRIPVGYNIFGENGIEIVDEHEKNFTPKIPLEILKRTVEQAVTAACRDCGYSGGVKLTLTLPNNAVVPKSIALANEKFEADRKSSPAATPENIIEALSALRENYETTVLLTPVDYGREYLERITGSEFNSPVFTGDYISFAVRNAKSLGFRAVLIIAHFDKAVKFVNGIFETSDFISKYSPHIMTAYAAMLGASVPAMEGIMSDEDTDNALATLKAIRLYDKVLEKITDETEKMLQLRFSDICIGVIAFSPKYGVLYKTSQVPLLIN